MEFTSKENIKELLVKPSKEFSLYTSFIHKFLAGMENYRECNLTLNLKNASSTLNSKECSLGTNHGASIFKEKEDNCIILYTKFVNIKIRKLVIFRIFM